MITTVLEYLDTCAECHPNKAAIIEGIDSVSYKAVRDRSKRIGTFLASGDPAFHNSNAKSSLNSKNQKQDSPLRRNSPVGVYMKKGIDALVSFLGIAYAGHCYAMLNTDLPDERLKQIQSVLQASIIITTNELLKKAEDLFPDADIITIENLLTTDINERLLTFIQQHHIDTDPLYINFTSGTTGIPKGIVVSHRSVIDFISCFTEIFPITDNDIIANQAPFDFDISVKDIYSCLKTGATLVIVPSLLFSSPTKLMDYLCENRVTTMIWAVSALSLINISHGLDYKTPATVSRILFSGEVMPYKHLCEWRKHLPDTEFVNLYGPTEITCNCTYHILEKNRDYSSGIPIGKVFPNEDVFLLNDENEKITEPGLKGEIIVRGTALAHGYYGSSEETAAVFIQNPLNSFYPETVYKTGDLGMYDNNGDLHFLGRTDNQVKYMGHRIELEEVEKAMISVEGVEQCFCIFDKARSCLKGYYTGTIEKKELYHILSLEKPLYMVPRYIRKLEAIPLSKNGKIDRRQFLES